MSRKKENKGFVCCHCGYEVQALSNGSYRNHCPKCLYSLHVDLKPGDRASTCQSPMRPIGVKQSSKKGWQIIHECTECGFVGVNKIAEMDDQSDDIDLIIQLSVN